MIEPAPGQAHRHQSLIAWFMQAAAARGGSTAMRWKRFGIWEEVSWADYAAKVRGCGAALMSRGFRRGDSIAVLSETRPDWLFLDFGAQSAGCIAVGIYTTDAARQAAYIVNDCAARLLFVDNEEQLDKALAVIETAPGLENIVCLDETAMRGVSHPKVISFAALLKEGESFDKGNPGRLDAEITRASREDVALVIYTSGTTGPPKGVMLSHGNLLFQMEAMERLCPGRQGDEQLSFLPLSHIVERYFTVYRPLNHGAAVNIGDGINALAEDLRQVAPDVMMAVPRVWEKLYSSVAMAISDSTLAGRWGYKLALGLGAKAAERRLAGKPLPLGLGAAYQTARLLVLNRVRGMTGLGNARLLISGAAPISPDLIRWYSALGIDMVEAYGQTECTGHATSYGKGEARPGTVGKAVAGSQLRLSEAGEILIKGPHVFPGYLNNPEKTAEAVREGWLHTGDVGTISADGYVTILDRLKDIIVTSGGKNITPSEIESRLKFSPYISDAVIIGDRRNYLTCLVMMDADTVMKFAQEANIPFTNFASLARAPEIRALIQREIDAVNADFARVESIRKFELIGVQLTADDEELTPTLKLKRQRVAERFKPLIDGMYRD